MERRFCSLSIVTTFPLLEPVGVIIADVTPIPAGLGLNWHDELAATLAAESGVTVFAVAFTRWIREDEQRSLTDIAADVLHELLTLTAAAQDSGRLPR